MSMSALEMNIKNFNILYGYLCRNINKAILLRPDFFTKKIMDEYEKILEKITGYYYMSYNFRHALHRTFLIVIKFLDSPANTIERRPYNFYRKKYIKRINKIVLGENTFVSINELLKDINGELIVRINELKSVTIDGENVSNIPYAQQTITRVNGPKANKSNTSKYKTATWRLINSPINKRAPLANATLKNKNSNRTAKGTKI